MKRYSLQLFCIVLVLCCISNLANAQTGSMAAAQPHIDKAKAAAYQPGYPLMVLYERVCGAALSETGPVEPGLQTAASMAERTADVPPRANWFTEPAKVFDNLYWLGTYGDGYSVPQKSGDSIWAVNTSEGIILIDTAEDYQAEELITNGLQKFGLDPADIKYVVLSHPHGDRYNGAVYVQDAYNARIIFSEADWDTLAKSNEPNELKPRKDMVATDGMKLTLGDTTLTLYITPGHTPGTISTVIPLKDGNQTHLGVVWGGINPSFERYGVQYYPSLQETFKTWAGSAARMQDIVAEIGADVYLAIHPFYDNLAEKIQRIKYRGPGDPHPLVSQDNLNRFLTIIRECTEAQLARIM